jgi:hypothetical protein
VAFSLIGLAQRNKFPIDLSATTSKQTRSIENIKKKRNRFTVVCRSRCLRKSRESTPAWEQRAKLCHTAKKASLFSFWFRIPSSGLLLFILYPSSIGSGIGWSRARAYVGPCADTRAKCLRTIKKRRGEYGRVVGW